MARARQSRSARMSGQASPAIQRRSPAKAETRLIGKRSPPMAAHLIRWRRGSRSIGRETRRSVQPRARRYARRLRGDAAMVARHGGEAVARAAAQATRTRRVECEDVPTLRWRDNYHRMLRLLETR